MAWRDGARSAQQPGRQGGISFPLTPNNGSIVTAKLPYPAFAAAFPRRRCWKRYFSYDAMEEQLAQAKSRYTQMMDSPWRRKSLRTGDCYASDDFAGTYFSRDERVALCCRPLR